MRCNSKRPISLLQAQLELSVFLFYFPSPHIESSKATKNDLERFCFQHTPNPVKIPKYCLIRWISEYAIRFFVQAPPRVPVHNRDAIGGAKVSTTGNATVHSIVNLTMGMGYESCFFMCDQTIYDKSKTINFATLEVKKSLAIVMCGLNCRTEPNVFRIWVPKFTELCFASQRQTI